MSKTFKKIFLIALVLFMVSFIKVPKNYLWAQGEGVQTSPTNSFSTLTPQIPKKDEALTTEQLADLSDSEILKRYEIDDPLYLKCWLEVTNSLKISRQDTLESLEHYLNMKTREAIKAQREKIQVPNYGVLDSYTDTLVDILTHFSSESPRDALAWFGDEGKNLINVSYEGFQKLMDQTCVKKYHVFVLV